jgi:hypothetical protein
MEAPSAPHIILGRVDDAINQVGQSARRRTAMRDARSRDGGVCQELAAAIGRVLINAQIAAPLFYGVSHIVYSKNAV